MGKKTLQWRTVSIAFITSVMCTACQIMPEEEVLPAIPVIRSYEAIEYTQAPVLRGDLTVNTTVSCTYVPAKEENLAFAIGGVYIDKVNVAEGQQVRAGEILVELEQENLQQTISNQEYELKVLRLKKEHLLENLQLDMRKHDIILKEYEWEIQHSDELHGQDVRLQKEKQEQKRAQEQAVYGEKIQDIEDAIYIQELYLDEMKANLKDRQLVAGIDGTITYVRKVQDGQRSVMGQILVTVSDMDTTVFRVKGKNALYFTVGEQVVLTSQKKEYTAEVVESSALGLEEQQEDDEPIAYLRLTQPDPTLEEEEKGTIQITLEERKDVLYVNKKAIKTSNGQSFVYMLDEEGLRIMQEVTTGLESGSYIEIMSGLKEGDSVIIE